MEPTLDLGFGTTLQLVLLVFSLLAVAFFSSSEASLISVNKVRMRHLAEQGNRSARAVMRIVGVEQQERFFATILLTENAFIILATSVGTAFTIRLLGSGGFAVLVATVAMTLLVVVFGEITPKSLAFRASERWSMVVSRPVGLIMALETPIIFAFTLLPRLILKLIGGAGKLVTPSITEGELRMLIDIAGAEGSVEMEEAEMLASVFRFGDRQVREMMTPRTEIVFIERGTRMGEFLTVYAENAHTRFPVYKGSTDDVVGILSAKDILRAMSTSEVGADDPVTTIIRDAYFVPETKRIAELFDELRGTGNQIAIAIDEFGGIAGLVTLKRLLEEVVGRVGEEGVSPAEEYEALGENTFQLDGSMNVDEVRDELGIDLGEGDFETVAGFVLEVLGHIPAKGETFDFNDLAVEVLEMDRLKIEAVKLTRRPARPT
jgi:CBS domain containing-hemolysin-like protein